MTTRATILHQFTTLDRLREFPKVRQNRQSNLVPVSNSSVGGGWWMVNHDVYFLSGKGVVTTSTVVRVCRSPGESIILLGNAALLFAPVSVLQGMLTAMVE